MKSKNLIVDKEKCIHCGLCVKDCIAHSLDMDEEKVPKFAKKGENRCIKCQHCLAICPVGALSILNKNPEDSELVEQIESEKVLNLIKSRRSFRHYKQENLPAETMEKLKDVLSWSPTGVNFHRLHFSFVEDISVMDKIRESVNKKLIKLLSTKFLNKVTGSLARYRKLILSGEDVIFRKAPHLVIVSAPVDAPCANVDPIIALSYFELYAQSLGVATCWCGLAQGCVQLFPEFAKQMKIPEGYKSSYAMLFGPPALKYSRAIQPEPFEMTVIDEFKSETLSFKDRVRHYFLNLLK